MSSDHRLAPRETATALGQIAALIATNAALVIAAVAGLAPAALMAALVLPLTLALVHRPQRGLMVLAALVPFNGLLLLVPQLPPLAAGWKEALVLATLGATFIAPAQARAARGRPLPSWSAAVGGLLILSLVSGLLVGGRQAMWGLKIAFFFVLVAVIVWRCPFDDRERDRLVTVLMVTGVLTALYGIFQQDLGPSRLNRLGYEYNSAIRFTRGLLRSFSTFGNPFEFGYFLMLVILVGLTFAMAQPHRLRTRLFFLMLPVLLLGLGTSFVRGAWLGLAAGLIYLGWARFRLLLLGLPLVAVGLILLPGTVSSAAFASSSSAERVQAWNANLSDITNHPLGIGVGSSNAAAEKVRGMKAIEDVFHPDNEYYRALYELGVLGLWFLVLLLNAAFRTTRMATRNAPPVASMFALATAAVIVAAVAASFVTTYFDTFPSNVYFWLFLGAVAAEHAGRIQNSAPDRAPVGGAAEPGAVGRLR